MDVNSELSQHRLMDPDMAPGSSLAHISPWPWVASRSSLSAVPHCPCLFRTATLSRTWIVLSLSLPFPTQYSLTGALTGQDCDRPSSAHSGLTYWAASGRILSAPGLFAWAALWLSSEFLPGLRSVECCFVLYNSMNLTILVYFVDPERISI